MAETLAPTRRAWRRWQAVWQNYSVALAFVVVIVLASFASPNFLSLGNLANIARQVSSVGIIALGMTLVIVSGGIDLSVGALLALTGGVTLLALNATHSIALGIGAGLGCGLAAGLVNGVLITKGRIPPFIATLGTMAAARSLILYIGDGGSVSSANVAYGNLANGELFGLGFPVWIMVALTLILFGVMRRTAFGRYVYASGSNERAARLSAIRVDAVKLGVYAVAGTLSAVAAVLESSRLNSVSSANSGLGYELDAIAAVIIGGTRMSGGRGGVIGTLIGVLILGILNNLLNLMNISPYLQGMVKGGLIVLAVLMQKKE